VQKCQEEGLSVAHAHLRYLNPFPRNLGDTLKRYRRVLIPELNLGQLRLLIRGTFLVDAKGYNKVQGRPFTVAELVDAIHKHIDELALEDRVGKREKVRTA
jgi:2-oxoglutarate ferredoxin oxidoreductase subunit alpha